MTAGADRHPGEQAHLPLSSALCTVTVTVTCTCLLNRNGHASVASITMGVSQWHARSSARESLRTGTPQGCLGFTLGHTLFWNSRLWFLCHWQAYFNGGGGSKHLAFSGLGRARLGLVAWRSRGFGGWKTWKMIEQSDTLTRVP